MSECPYCAGERDVMYLRGGGEVRFEISTIGIPAMYFRVNPNVNVTAENGLTLAIKIKFCPMCGRKL